MSSQTQQMNQDISPAAHSAELQSGLQDDLTLLEPPPPVPVMRLPEAGSHIYVWGAVVLACLTIGIILWRIGHHTNWTFRKPEPAHKRALRELKAWQSLQDEAQFREAVAGISGILRRYVDSQFKLPAPQLTSEEFWMMQQASGLLPKEYESFWEEFLPSTDRIKYTGQGVATQQFQELLHSAQAFVNQSATSMTQTRDNPKTKINQPEPNEFHQSEVA